MEYIVLVSDNSQKLTENVKDHLELGWKLQGGVSISVSESDDYLYAYYAQAMVRDLSN